MSAPEPETAPMRAPAAHAPVAHKRSRLSPKLMLGLLLLWGAATGLLFWISKSSWWLCALGGLGAVLVIWPGPKSQ